MLSPGILAVYRLSAQCLELFLAKQNIESQLLLLTLLYDTSNDYAFIF